MYPIPPSSTMNNVPTVSTNPPSKRRRLEGRKVDVQSQFESAFRVLADIGKMSERFLPHEERDIQRRVQLVIQKFLLCQRLTKGKAEYNLGLIYLYPNYGKLNGSIAVGYLEKANQEGEPLALFELAKYHIYVSKDQERAFSYLKKAEEHYSEFFDSSSLLKIGELLLKMDGDDKILKQAIGLFEKILANASSETSHLNKSRVKLCEIYLGFYCQLFTNPDEAQKYLSLVPKECAENLWGELGAYFYERSEYVKAAKAFEEEGEKSKFSHILFKMYYFGFGFDTNFEKAFIYLRTYVPSKLEISDVNNLSIDQKNAIYYLGVFYAEGIGTEVDFNQAEYYFSCVRKCFKGLEEVIEEIKVRNLLFV